MVDAINPVSPAAPWSVPLTVSELPTKKATQFALKPEAAILRAIRDELGLSGLRKLVFSGEIHAVGATDWQLTAHLGVTVQQACVVTLAPVSARLEEDVTRRYIRQTPDSEESSYEEGSELEMPADDTTEMLADTIDPGAVMIEALALALPPFPRAPDAELNENTFTEPGKSPMSDADARPFSTLKALRDKLRDDTD